MHLPDDTIVNGNIANVWRSGRYDKQNGIEEIFKCICEGIVVLKKEVKNRNHLTGYKIMKQDVPNDKIEKYVKSLAYRSAGKYDAVIVVKLKKNFSVYLLRLDTKTYERLQKKSSHDRKQIEVVLVMKDILNGMKY